MQVGDTFLVVSSNKTARSDYCMELPFFSSTPQLRQNISAFKTSQTEKRHLVLHVALCWHKRVKTDNRVTKTYHFTVSKI